MLADSSTAQTGCQQHSLGEPNQNIIFCPDDTYELNINELDFFAYSNNILYEWC